MAVGNDYRRFGALGGWVAGAEEGRTQQKHEADTFSTLVRAQRELEELKTYRKDVHVRAAKRKHDISKYQIDARRMAVAENRENLEYMAQGISQIASQEDYTNWLAQNDTKFGADWRKSNWGKNLSGDFKRDQSKLRMTYGAVTDTLKHRQAQIQQQQKDEAAMERQRVSSAATMGAARINAQSRMDVMREQHALSKDAAEHSVGIYEKRAQIAAQLQEEANNAAREFEASESQKNRQSREDEGARNRGVTVSEAAKSRQFTSDQQRLDWHMKNKQDDLNKRYNSARDAFLERKKEEAARIDREFRADQNEEKREAARIAAENDHLNQLERLDEQYRNQAAQNQLHRESQEQIAENAQRAREDLAADEAARRPISLNQRLSATVLKIAENETAAALGEPPPHVIAPVEKMMLGRHHAAAKLKVVSDLVESAPPSTTFKPRDYTKVFDFFEKKMDEAEPSAVTSSAKGNADNLLPAEVRPYASQIRKELPGVVARIQKRDMKTEDKGNILFKWFTAHVQTLGGSSFDANTPQGVEWLNRNLPGYNHNTMRFDDYINGKKK